MIEDPPQSSENINRRYMYSVSELNAAIKTLLEDHFPFIWLTGEISNFRSPASGHFYFTLKDPGSQISAVMFRGQQRQLKFVPEDGMTISGMGRISVYEPRGIYQIILEYMEPAGVGALQIAFEQLKKRLTAEGLFDEQSKRDLPLIPRKIGIITSPSGAVVHDILRTIDRRFPNLQIQIIPVRVQGQGAAEMIETALSLANSRMDTDVLILARGGGSLEDLQAFNSEIVARAIFDSQIPIVSAVGHETDYTIADFVADLRAPTPTAAAELTAPEKSELQHRCSNLAQRLNLNIINNINILNTKLNGLSKRLIDPRRRLEDYRLRLDDLCNRLLRILRLRIRQDREYLQIWEARLGTNQPHVLISKYKIKLEKFNEKLTKSFIIFNQSNKIRIRELTAKLETLSPLAILGRGYSITRTIPDASVLKDSRMVLIRQDLEIILAKGRLLCQIKGKTNYGEKEL